MQRIRAGVTGLSLVFLVTLLGSIAIGRDPAARDPRPASASEPGEPLSELGVAPAPQREVPEAEQPAAGRNGFPASDVEAVRI